MHALLYNYIRPQQEVVLFLVHPLLNISLGCFFSNTPNAHAQITPTHFGLSGCCTYNTSIFSKLVFVSCIIILYFATKDVIMLTQ